MPAAPALAQSTVLVSNLGQTRAAQPPTTLNRVFAQGFTTGSNAGGYTLSSIAVESRSVTNSIQRAAIRAELWSAATGGGPGSKIAELTVPPAVPPGTVSFEAPANTWLLANTTYFIVPYTTADHVISLGLVSTTNEDAGSQAGWSIQDNLHFQRRNLPGAGSWSSQAQVVLAIRVSGAAAQLVVPAAPRGLGVTPGAAKLDLSWTAPLGSVTGYDVHYTSSTTVGNDAGVQTGASPSAASGWVDAEHSGTAASHAISGLTNNTAYRVRVRAKNGAGDGAWAFGSGTPKATVTGSTDATLSALALADGSGDGISFGTFAATTHAYAANVAADTAAVKVTPTVSESNATVRVGKGTSLSAVSSGSASGAVALDFGANAISVEVTAQAGNTRTYTITVHRALPEVSWAELYDQTCPLTTGAPCVEGDTATLGLNASLANAMSGTVTYAGGTTHPASPEDDLGSARTAAFTMAASDEDPSAIEVPIADDAVNEEHETFTVTIGPGTGYTPGSPRTVTVTILDNDSPAAPGRFAVTSGDAKLTASWSRPAGPLTRYRLRWKETAAPDRSSPTLTNPATGWVAANASATATTAEIASLTNGTSYDVQVAANDGQTGSGNGWGDWTATQAETPSLPMSDVPRSVRAAAGNARLTLSWRAPASWATRTGWNYRVEWKPSTGSSSDWSVAAGGGTLRPSATSYEFTGAQTDADGAGHTVANGTSYDLRIRASSLKPGTDGTDPGHVEHSAWVAVLNNVPSVPPSRSPVLVSNLGQLRSAQFVSTENRVAAQGFTTGSNAGGYTLSGIAVESRSGASETGRRTIRAELWSAAAGGGPDAKVAELAVPSTVARGAVDFAAPANTWLRANTTYFVVLYTTTSSYTMRLDLASTADEDAGGEAGWSILDDLHYQSGSHLPGAGSWSSQAGVVVAIRVGGSAARVAVPAAPRGLGVTPGAAKLDLSWTAPPGALTGYDVHYTSAAAGTVANDAEASGSNASAAWVDAEHSGTEASHAISGLTNDTLYRVRVRGVNALGDGAWAFGSGTPKATVTGSTDATLSGLSLADGSGDGISFSVGAFSSATYAYEANVAADTVAVKVTPTVNESNATVTVDGTAVSSGSASGAVALDFGANAVEVEVTAQAGNTRTYTITVHRALPLVSWAAATATTCPRTTGAAHTACIEGDAATLGLNANFANAMSGAVTYATGATHPASLDDDLGSARTMAFTMAADDDAPSAIEVPIVDDAVNEEHETFTVTIEEGTGYTVGSPGTVTITIVDNEPPAAPGSFNVASGDTKLRAGWSRPAGALAGYELDWKETAAPDSAVRVGSGDPSAGWVTAFLVAEATTSEITSLTNGTQYDVRIRATDGQTATGNGYGPWTALAQETPRLKTYGFARASSVGPPGATADLKVELSEAAPAGGLALTVTRLLGTDLPENLCTGTLAAAADIGTSPPATATVKAGLDTVTVSYPLADNGDDLVGGAECFALRLGASAYGWTAGDNGVAKVTVTRAEGRIAFGSGAAATAKHTATVAETVSGGTLSVPLTVDHLPSAATTFTVGVLSGGTATEWTSTSSPGDFRIGTKTVEFGPSTSKTLNLAVTITNDLEVEDDETIELGIVAAPTGDETLNTNYTRNAQGRLATVTITSEDAVPGKVTDLAAASDSAKLEVTWTAPESEGSSALTGYDVHYTSAPKSGNGAVADGATASGSDASAAWVDAGHSGTDPEADLTGLANNTEYRVRARAENAVGAGEWEFTTGTPKVAPSSNADLSALAASTSTSAGGTYAALDIGTFAAATTSYSATVPHAATHAKLTPTAAHAGATVTVDGATVTSGSASAAISLGVGANAVAVAVTPETGADDRKTYTVTITREGAVPGKVTDLDAAPDSARLDVSWTAPASAGSSALTGYDVHYTSAPKTGTGAVADGAEASGSDASAAWVDAGHSGTDPDDELTGLANGTEYRVRVRAENASGAGEWEFATGTPKVAPSSNADLSGLTASAGTSAGGTFTSLTLSPSFAAATTSYAASVPHAATHAKLTPATAHSGAAVTVDGAAVTSGSASAAIALAVGANAIAVAVTPETGAADRKTYTVTITREGPPPEVSLAARPNPVGEGGDVAITATLTRALAADVTIPLTVGGGTAESGDHGTLASVTVRGGLTSGSGTISTAADEDEDDETFTVSLGTLPPEVVAGTPSSVEVRITEDEPGPARVRLEVSPNPASEDAGSVTLTARLTRAAPAGGATVVFYQTGGTAYPVVDYAFDPPAGGTSHGETAEIAVAAGARAAAARLVLVDDDLAEGDETVVLAARSSAAPASSGSVTLVIEDDEGATEATIEASPEVFAEGGETEVTVFLTQPAARVLEIPLDVTFVTAEREDVRGPWTVLVHPGERWGSTVFEAMQDDDEDDETFTVALDPDELPAPLVAGDPSEAELTIIDDDGATVTIEARPNPVAEGGEVRITARLSEAAGEDLAIPVTVARGSSEAGDHGTLESIGIARGRTSGSGTVATHADADADDETFTVALGTLPDGLSAGDPSEVEVVIEDPDGKAPGAVRSLAVAAGERTTLDVTWQAPAEGSVTGYDVHYTSSSTVADGAPCCAPADASWADAGHSGTDPSHTVERLNDGTRYRVRVRAKSAGGEGAWAFGAGTTRQPAGSSVDLTALAVTAADSANGTYAALTLVPSFRPSVTTYEAARPRSRTHLKITATARDPSAEIIAHGHLMASGATTPALPVSAGVYYIAVSNASGHYKEYVVEVYAAQSSSASQAARSAARSVTRAAADARAALALLGGVGPDDAAEALLGGRGLGADRLEALDRLGNANGRYDVGDLLAWIERCKSGRARCGKGPNTLPPASDAALPGAAGAAAAKRPRGRGAGPGRPKRRRRWRGLLPLLAVLFWSCDGGVGLTGPAVPEPGYLSVEWTAPPGGPKAAGALVEIDGPGVAEVRAPGLDLYGSGQGGGPRRFVVAGDPGGGPAIEFRVPDRRQAHLYAVRVVEVAGEDHRLLDADDYRAAVGH